MPGELSRDIFTCDNNILPSNVKLSPLLWLHNKSRLSHQKTIKVKWFGCFIGVYIINRTLHGRLEIRNFPSRVEKIFHSFAALIHEIFFNTVLEEKFHISARPCNILYFLHFCLSN